MIADVGHVVQVRHRIGESCGGEKLYLALCGSRCDEEREDEQEQRTTHAEILRSRSSSSREARAHPARMATTVAASGNFMPPPGRPRRAFGSIPQAETAAPRGPFGGPAPDADRRRIC
jgi:hypothetical protein